MSNTNNAKTGVCPVFSTSNRPFPVILIESKSELPSDAIKLHEASNETYSHYVGNIDENGNGDHFGYKKKNPKRYAF